MSVDIIKLIDENPLDLFNFDYKEKLLSKINNTFNEEEQKLFLFSFYMYLKYDPNKDYIVNMDNIWKWIGFQRKRKFKELIIKYFRKDIDYSVEYYCPIRGIGSDSVSKEKQKEKILMTFNTFKKLCLKARTSQADRIHDYFIKLETILMDITLENNEYLVSQLKLKDDQIKETLSIAESNLIMNSMDKTLVYLGEIDGGLIKFGMSKKIQDRVIVHKKDFDKFVLKYTIQTPYYTELEDEIKRSFNDINSPLYDCRVSKEINGKNQTELIRLKEGMTIDDLYDYIVELNRKLIDYKTGNKDKIISDLRKQVFELKEKIKTLNNVFENKGIEVPNIGIKYNNIEKNSEKYFYEFFYNYIKDLEGINKIETNIILESYQEYIKTKYGITYLLDNSKFISYLNSIPFVKSDRLTVSRDDPRYHQGLDNRVKCKRIAIDSKNKQNIKNLLT